ncbi:hypothetical protein GJV04_07160 [Enterobacteriaceae bacterium RIT714]|nr:hypothetical protein [Enterobacteriaceae bacterium RIT714]
MIRILFLSTALISASGHTAPKTSSLLCKAEALKESQKLLSYYSSNDDRINIDDKVTPLWKINNPANAKQHFDVIEIWGYIYKGKYRMRMTYYSENHDLGCLLMGEDILEFADL